MAATTTTTFLKLQNQPTKPKRRKYRETTISAAASPNHTQTIPHRRTPQSPICSQTPSNPQPPALPQSPSSTHTIPFSPIMDFTHSSPTANGHHPSHPQSHDFPSSFSKFNSALTAGLLNPMSPPPDKTRSSPTLFEMMASEPDVHHRPTTHIPPTTVSAAAAASSLHKPQILDRHALMMQRISDLLGSRSPGNQFNDAASSDIKLTLSSKDGISVSMNVHRQILVAHSRFFSVKLSDRWTKQQQQRSPVPYEVEIADCDDVEVYIETLRLMYCKDLRKKLMREDVSRVLGILKVSAAIGFDAGVLSCLEYLEAAPWAEDEEEKVASLLSELRLEAVGAGEVLKRVSTDAAANGNEEGSDNEEVLLKLIRVVLEGKDEKARREMKGLVSKMLHENSSQNDLRKESLYLACGDCLQLLRDHFLQAAGSHLQDVSQIARQADNLHWILDILVDRQIAEDFLKTWASQADLAEAHSKVPAVHRFEVSRVTARLFVGIGKGQLLASKDVRCLLLKTWLVPFYDDFGWMRRASKGLDRHLIEDGLSNTILTLPLSWQQDILLAWFDRFLNSGEDCPNIQRGFEVWWRRAFWKRNGEQERTRQLRITTTSVENP
ncbi:BTB/POZ domain-containing protein At1g63850 [Vigna radiata var. radiata]|uniref:BTB/POZ domain-containing protein At1g63850 n=1 Tax=Vigna radiata var. radiata TaxID=3916 RepID=A0A1S3UU85_VIGRR|nr:BTB/POZ domain-containing protein At1g63850 [Vigna radiata var. radiata]XP_022640082.1 BTB/POZ domain-containing protein At1g63850 [Vigna radiata var. radiata]